LACLEACYLLEVTEEGSEGKLVAIKDQQEALEDMP
jgi:hypothetical protein